MKICEFLESTSNGQVLCGTVTLDGETVSYVATAGYEILMRNVVKDHVIADGCRRVFAKDDAKTWFANLPREYNGSRLTAGIVHEPEQT